MYELEFDPFNPTNYEYSEKALQEFLLFSIFVPGKSAAQTIKKLKLLLEDEGYSELPFLKLGKWLESGVLDDKIKHFKFGQYTRLSKTIPQLIKVNPKLCSITDLEAIPGIGPKSARFYILHSRRNVSVAVLDTHILKWLGSTGYAGIPKSTPTTKSLYLKIENYFLQEVKKLNITAAELDFKIWYSYANNKNI